MAKKWYPKALEHLLVGDVDVTDGTLTIAAVDSTYVWSSAHEFLDDVTGVLGTPQVLTSVSVTGGSGAISATSPDYPDVTLGQTIKGFVIYSDTGVAGTSVLLLFLDTRSDSSPVSINGDGSDLPVTFRDGKPGKLVGV